MSCQKLLAHFLREDWVSDIEKVLQNDRVLLVLGDLVNFVHHIDKSLELLLRDSFLLDDLASHISWDRSVAHCNFVVDFGEELPVSVVQLVVIDSVVEVGSICEDGGDVFEVVRRLGDHFHGLVLEIELDDRHSAGVPFLPHALDFGLRLLDLGGHGDLVHLLLQHLLHLVTRGCLFSRSSSKSNKSRQKKLAGGERGQLRVRRKKQKIDLLVRLHFLVAPVNREPGCELKLWHPGHRPSNWACSFSSVFCHMGNSKQNQVSLDLFLKSTV